MSQATQPIAVLVGLATMAATICGGALALRFRSVLGALLAFSSGAMLGVALFDLLPEALSLGAPEQPPLTIMTAVAAGFVLYLAAGLIAAAPASAAPGRSAFLGPASLTAHSFMDGLGIGLAFHVSSAVGLVVAIAVVAHDLIDGANTVILSLSGDPRSAVARRWLVLDALAPLAGLAAARFAAIPPSVLALLLAGFAGSFLYIATTELLPRSRSVAARPALICGGLAFVWAAVHLSS